MPALNTIHIDTALTNLSIMYRNDTYVADQVCPVVPVAKRADRYFIYNKEDYLSASALDGGGRPKSLRKPGSEAAELDYGVTTGQYYAEEYAYRGLVTDAEVAISDNPLQPDMDQTVQLTERLMLDNEVQVATLFGNAALYPATSQVTLVALGTSWAAYASATSLPLNDIRNGRQAVIAGIAKDANTFMLSIDSARVLADHPTIKDITKYTHKDGLTVSGLPPVIRGLTVIEAPAQRNTAAEGLAYAGGNVWRSTLGVNFSLAVIFYRNPAPSLRSVSMAYTFEAPDDATGVRGYAVRRWREDKRKGNMVEVSCLRDWRGIALDGTGLFTAGYHIAGSTD